MSPAGRLLLNRRLVQAPVDAIDYVITHELCHVAEPHHGSLLRSPRQGDARLGAPEAETGTGHGLRTSEPGRGSPKRDSNPRNFNGLNFYNTYKVL
ncbi:M48 family metallopeptidase [Paracoccus yeei]|uniref:M48 metallopeptidase family protein n=1 Tax=Paracoccus yeei TaxID=147645 RepID=UPI003BF79B13